MAKFGIKWLDLFNSVSLKSTPVAADRLLLEDSADDSKKYVTAVEARKMLQVASYADFFIDASDFVARTTNGALANTEELATNDVMNVQFLFDKDTEEAVQRKFRMPDDWDLGSFKAKVLWDGAAGASATEVALWGIRGVAAGDGEAMDQVWGAEVEVSDALIALGAVQESAATAAITIGNTPALGKLIWLQVSRKAADGIDTLGSDAKFLGVAIQYGVLAASPAAW